MPKKITPPNNAVSGSFRDPSGTVFRKNGSIYRRINVIYKDNYNFLINSGLYAALIKDRLLISHQEVTNQSQGGNPVFKVIKPEIIPFVSYPYEWSFSQFKAAALLTLLVQKKALEYGMSLKDASAYNIQFSKGKPILIDTLSFKKYEEGLPWAGYKQFCQHFLAPIALMCYKDLRIGRLSQNFIDGIPLDLASSMLPASSYFNFPILTHIHLHAKSGKYFTPVSKKPASSKMSRLSFLGLIDSLESAVKGLEYKFKGLGWSEYYSGTNYSKTGMSQKQAVVADFLRAAKPKTVWDLGANTGLFSRIAEKMGIATISIDSDAEAVEKNYLRTVQAKEENILPLTIDLINPSPGIGWMNAERINFFERGPADMVFALALIHHLAISNNLPFEEIANFFKSICRFLVIEFVPKNDSNARKLFLFRKDIFPDYNLEEFIFQFSKYFIIKKTVKIKKSQRMLFLMERK